MTELSRRNAFLVSVVAVICAAASVSALKPRSSDGGAAAARFGPLVAGDGGASGVPHARRTSGPAPTPAVRNSLAGARASAWSFARAFLRYQAGDKGTRTRVLLARSGSERVHRYLVTSPVRRAGQRPHAELRSIRVYKRARPAEAKASVLLRYGRGQSLFEFLLKRGRNRWRVTELYP
jgi:hypothetical protein